MRRVRPAGRAPRRGPSSVPLLRGAALVVLAGTLAGCGALFGGRYNNFRAYYNTFYNAQQAFEQGERQLRRPDQRVDRARFLPLFPTAQVGATAAPVTGGGAGGGSGNPFQRAIDKSADLLRERPDSKYADDALLLIGKSYFYTGNYVGAEQKFRETAAAAEERRQRALLDEARFWLGRTLGAARRFDEGASVLEAALADPEASRAWRPRLRLALGELHAEARRWDEATAALRSALHEEGRLGDELAARAQFLLGQVLEAAGRPAEAAEAYGAVLRHGPPYELGYAAELSRALALGLGAGRPDEALTLLRRMRRDGKHYANRAEVELAYARALAAAGQADEARTRFEAVLYDRTLGGTTVRGEALFRFAEYHRDVRGDLVRAAVYFDSAATSVRTEPGREERVTGAALSGVRRTADVYGAYAALAERLRAADSLLALGALDEAAFRARVAAIETERRQTWLAEQRRLARERAAAGFGDVTTPTGAFGAALRPGGPDDGGEGGTPGGTPGAPPTGTPAEAGFLAYRDLPRVEASRLAFERVWGERPRVPNWRRRAAIGGAAVATGPGLDATTGPEGATDLDGPPPLDLSVVPRSPEARDALRLERAGLRYEVGNVLFLSIADATAAEEWYRLVVDEDPESPVAVRALYALAEVARAQGRPADAEALYRRVLEAEAEGPLAEQARERLGLAPARADAGDSAADSAYAAARRLWAIGAYPAVVAEMLAVAATYPEAAAAPRALLGAAVAYTEWALRDSLSFDALPDSLIPPALRDSLLVSPAPGEVALPEPVPEDEALRLEAGEGGEGEREGEEEIEGREEEAGVPGAPTPVTAPPPAPPPDPPAAATGDSSAVAGPAAPVALPGPDDAVGVADLYRYVVARYPGTPYAERAQALLAALGGPAAPEEEDPFAIPTPDAPAPDPAAGTLTGRDPVDPAGGGFTWRVATVPTPLAARALLRNFVRRGFRSGATVDVGEDGEVRYAVVVGQFATPEAAEATRSELPVTGLGAAVEVVPVEGLVFVTEEQLAEEARGERPALED